MRHKPQLGCDHTLHDVDGKDQLTGSWAEEISVPGGPLKIQCRSCGRFYGYLAAKTSPADERLLTEQHERRQTGSSSLIQGPMRSQGDKKSMPDANHAARRLPIDFKALKRMVPIARVLELIEYKPRKKTGSQLRGPCPVHGSASSSSTIFSVNLERSIYKCFSCDSGGDQIKLYAEITGLGIYEAAEQLAANTGCQLPYKSSV